MRINRTLIPWLMAAGRAALGPILIAGARANWNGLAFAAIVLTAMLSDIFDGVLARRWHCDTPAVRLFDSMADTVFYFGTGIALCLAQPTIMLANRFALLTLCSMEATRFTFDTIKFGKPASYHSYLAKFWGLLLAPTVIAVFTCPSRIPSLALPFVLWIGVVCNLQDLFLSIILPTRQHDVKHIPAGLRLRRQLLAETPALSTNARVPQLIATLR
jgi:CDP-diacylglycerol--glycerol-3-phosphate 3-phosphatidyltransferase